MLVKYFLLLLTFLFIHLNVKSEKLIEFFKWKQIEFESPSSSLGHDIVFPDELKSYSAPHHHRYHEKQNLDYIPYNNVPMGVSHHKDKLFITVPRRRSGIPATLNYISLTNPLIGSSPKLNAYPSYAMNRLEVQTKPGEETLVSVYRTKVDVCNRLWFIDTGMLEYPNNRTQLQQPSIWIMDLNTNTRIHRFEIPQNVVDDGRGLASIAIDVDEEHCENAFGYIPDLYMNALYVYRADTFKSLQQNRMWTFKHNYFSFDPLWGNLNIAGQQFQWNDGIFSISLSNKNPAGYRTAYFHPMISISEFGVNTKVLRNETNSLRSYHRDDFKFLGYRGSNKQSSKHDYDLKTGILMFAEIQNSGVGCWNTNKKLSEQTYTTLQKDDKTMIYPSDLTIDSEGTVWIMTNSIPLFIYASLNPHEYNFRIWKQSVEKLTENTLCDIRSNNNKNYNYGNYTQI